MTAACLVLGAGGQVGRLLRGIWDQATGGAPVLFHARAPGPGIAVHGAIAPDLVERISGPVASVTVLAGVSREGGPPLSGNTDCAIAGLDLALRLKAPRVFLASSAAVYGRPGGNAAFRETDTPVPTRPYGASKLAMEAAAAIWLQSAGPSAPVMACLRMANVAGADMLAASVRSARPDAPLVLDRFEDGAAPRRAYLSASTLARVIHGLSDPDIAPVHGPLNLAEAGDAVAMDAMLAALARAGFEVPWHWQPAPTGALPRLALDTARMRRLLPGLVPNSIADQLVRDWLQASGGRP